MPAAWPVGCRRQFTRMRTTLKPKPDFILPEPTEADIQKKAYHRWIEGGRLEGVELDNWFAAKELLRHGHRRQDNGPAVHVHFAPSHAAQRPPEAPVHR
jgi:Protein of unknown function (DUF2934)